MIWGLSLAGDAILLLYQFSATWPGFILNNSFCLVNSYCHYLPMIKFFVNEYYMAAILHYMSYASVEGSHKKTLQRFKSYCKRRDIIVIVYKVSFPIFFAACTVGSVILIKR